jgi:hypothetical protein
MRLFTLLACMLAFAAQAQIPIFIERADIVSFADGRVYVCKAGTSKIRRNADQISLDCFELSGPWLKCEGNQKDRNLSCRPHKE